jgi:hypothetical protein
MDQRDALLNLSDPEFKSCRSPLRLRTKSGTWTCAVNSTFIVALKGEIGDFPEATEREAQQLGEFLATRSGTRHSISLLRLRAWAGQYEPHPFSTRFAKLFGVGIDRNLLAWLLPVIPEDSDAAIVQVGSDDPLRHPVRPFVFYGRAWRIALMGAAQLGEVPEGKAEVIPLSSAEVASV